MTDKLTDLWEISYAFGKRDVTHLKVKKETRHFVDVEYASGLKVPHRISRDKIGTRYFSTKLEAVNDKIRETISYIEKKEHELAITKDELRKLKEMRGRLAYG